MHFYQKNIPDFNNATRHLTRVERSLFSDAIELYYDTELPLTLDIKRLERLLLAQTEDEKNALKNVLDEFFITTDEGFFNKRCNEEILKYQAFMQNKSKAGKASAEQRAQHKSTGVEQVLNRKETGEQLTNTQYPIPITNNPIPIKNITRINALDETFEKFWTDYPKKVGKDKALLAWKKKKPNIDIVLKALHWQKVSDSWQNGYIPNPTTYINEGRWKDEPPAERYAF